MNIEKRLSDLERLLPEPRKVGPLVVIVHPGEELPQDAHGAFVIDCRAGSEPPAPETGPDPRKLINKL